MSLRPSTPLRWAIKAAGVHRGTDARLPGRLQAIGPTSTGCQVGSRPVLPHRSVLILHSPCEDSGSLLGSCLVHKRIQHGGAPPQRYVANKIDRRLSQWLTPRGLVPNSKLGLDCQRARNILHLQRLGVVPESDRTLRVRRKVKKYVLDRYPRDPGSNVGARCLSDAMTRREMAVDGATKGMMRSPKVHCPPKTSG